MAYGNLCSWMLWNIVRKVSMKAVLIPLPWMTLLYLVTGSFRDMEKCTILICGITSLSIRRTCQQKILQEFINVLSMWKTVLQENRSSSVSVVWIQHIICGLTDRKLATAKEPEMKQNLILQIWYA